MKLTKQQLLEEDLICEPETLEIKTWATKHDCHATQYVSKIGDKYYKYTLEFSYNDGCIIFDYSGQDWLEAEEVRPVEIKSIKWEKVK